MNLIASAATILACSLAPLSPSAAEDGLDHKLVLKHIQKSFSVPPEVEFAIKDVKASPIAGFVTGTLETSYRGKTQSQAIHITKDNKYYILSAAYALAPSKIQGLLSPGDAGDSTSAQVYVSKDFQHFLMGEAHDLAVDPDAANMSKIRVSGAAGRGTNNAPIIVAEYSDLQCPFCKNAHLALDKQLLAAYPGKVRWLFKHFPLTNIHPWAYSAAIAAGCAARQKPEASWKMETYLFENQDQIKPDNIREKAVAAAKQAGINPATFETCYDKQESRPAIEADIEEAKSLRVDSTPTFFINGRKLSGFRDFDTVKKLIDSMLAEKAAK